MADPTPLPGIDDKLRRINERLRSGGSGGDGPTGGDLEPRIAALEKVAEKLDNKLETINGLLRDIGLKLTQLEAKLDQKASADDLAVIRGRVDSLPTTWQMITLVFGILGGAFLILRFGLPHGS